MSSLKSACVLAAAFGLAVPVWAADGQGNPDDCKPRHMAKNERVPFSIEADDSTRALVINGDIRVRLYKGSEDITHRLEPRVDGETREADAFLELHGKEDHGRYVLEIEQGGVGSICVSAPG
ncbi:hypothetical protein L1281_000161 [Neisseria sp. HSC-16F19]|nr:hypothetical protein [Neisseria sp. HSC-16F19]MCP2039596.1 hypothetical protein [Neisseria sp. HSC-16F19]